MTRINLVPPAELCDQHLLAEWRELTRIPNGITKGIFRVIKAEIPLQYTIRTEDRPEGGHGHVKFFFNKLWFLYKRYKSLIDELEQRGFDIQDIWPPKCTRSSMEHLWNDYSPSATDIELNRKRIRERFPKKARYAKEKL